AFVFFRTISSHKRTGEKGRGVEAWMLLVIASSFGFLLTLLFNAAMAIQAAVSGDALAFPHSLDQRFLVLATWGSPVLAIWGFNARWLPAFLGLRPSSPAGLLYALGACAVGVTAALAGNLRLGSAFLILGASIAATSLNIFERAERPAKLQGVHPS